MIGGRGFIGRNLTRRLNALGWSCHVVGRDDPWPTVGELSGTVFYCAGLTADFLRDPFETVEAHVSSLARALKAPGVDHLIYLSSTRLYDDLPCDSVATEQTTLPISPHVPRHLFDITKLAGESLCHIAGSGRACVVRLSSVYGEIGNKDGFLGQLLEKIAVVPSGSDVVIESSSNASRDYIHIDDVLDALLTIAVRRCCGTFNVASGVNMYNYELATMLFAKTGRRLVFTGEQVSRGHARIDVSRLQSLLGITPRTVSLALSDWFRTLF